MKTSPLTPLISIWILLVAPLSQASVAHLPAGLKAEEMKIEAAITREAASLYAESHRNCQDLKPELSYKKRINIDLLLVDVRLKWADRACTTRLPDHCQSVYSLKEGLVDLSCNEGDENWE